MLAVVVAILARRAWVSISALALDERGYEQNHAARQRAADLVADGYHGFISGHTHHPELAATASGFYANSGSCTSVVEGIGGRFGLPPAYVRNQQICWVELDGEKARAGLGPGRAAGRDQDGAVRRAGPQPALGHPGARRLLARRPRLARAGQEGRPEEARPARSPERPSRPRAQDLTAPRPRSLPSASLLTRRPIPTGQPRSAARASSMVSSAAGSASRRSSGIGSPLRTDRP